MTYPGGKSGAGVFQRIINLMPPHRIYVEPFLGGGAILRHKRLAPISFGIDKDFDALLEAADEVRAVHPDVDLKVKNGANRATIANDIYLRDDDDRTVVLYCGCGTSFLQQFPEGEDVLVYADPPYVRSSRKTTRDIYAHEMTDADHDQLLKALVNFPGRALVSGYASDLYHQTLATWNTTTFQAKTRGGMATETLWFNYDEPTALHDCRYLGENFREREKIRRRIRRWEDRLERMKPLERQAMFQAIRSKFPEISIQGD